MRRDVDLLRDLLLKLEDLERSPPEPIFIALEEVARTLDRLPFEIVAHLELLADLNFIDGPGAYKNGAWLFRKLTPRGCALADNIRDENIWREIKDSYAAAIGP